MKAGALNRRFTLQTRDSGKDDFGGVKETFTAGASFWGALKPASAHRVAQMAQLDHQVTHTIEVRFRSDILPGSRLTSGARSFTVATVVDPDDRRARLVLSVLEGKST